MKQPILLKLEMGRMKQDQLRLGDDSNSELEEGCFQLNRFSRMIFGGLLGVCIGAVVISQFSFFLPGKRGLFRVLGAGAVLGAFGAIGVVCGYALWLRNATALTLMDISEEEDGDLKRDIDRE